LRLFDDHALGSPFLDYLVEVLVVVDGDGVVDVVADGFAPAVAQLLFLGGFVLNGLFLLLKFDLFLEEFGCILLVLPACESLS
jgi:hypothetical protein